MMPAMFTCGRTAGWCAHILEQKRLGKLVRPSAIYVGPGPRSPNPSRAGTKSPSRDCVFRARSIAHSPRRHAVSPRWCTTSPADRWDGPGLGEWDLRSLVGHTSRSLITVEHLSAAARRARGHHHTRRSTTRGSTRRRSVSRLHGIVERGRQAGRDLGADPAATIDGLVSRVLGELSERRQTR